MYGFDHGMWMLGGWMMMLVLWLLPFAVLLIAGWIAFKKVRAQPPAKTALAILEDAYARGQIGREEFLQKRDDIERKTNT